MLALAGLYFGITKRQRIAPAISSKSTGQPAATISEKSVAVLPFENLSKDEENAFFAGGAEGAAGVDRPVFEGEFRDAVGHACSG